MYGCYIQFTLVYTLHLYTFMKFIKITPPLPCYAPLFKNKLPKRINILKQKMCRPTTDTQLSDLNLLFSLYAYRAIAWGGAGRDLPPPPLFFPPKSQNMHKLKLKLISQSIETMMSLQLGETFSGFKIETSPMGPPFFKLNFGNKNIPIYCMAHK